jgi:antibiotic biosynthesis monooxygenase (ABM) superfamily enzyme
MNPNAHPNQPQASRGRRLARRVVTTLAAWLAAYAVVTVVVTLGGAPLAAAPAAVRTLVISGALVIIMLNVLMPVLGGLVARLFAVRP